MPTVYQSPKSAQQAGLVRLAHHVPYLAESAYGHTFVPTPGLRALTGGISWIGVDKHARIYFDDAEILTKEPFEIAVTFTHEVWHTLREHAARAVCFWASIVSDATLGSIVAGMDDGQRQKVWNLAGDAEINDDLETQFGFTPEGAALFKNWITPAALRRMFNIATADGAMAEEYARAIIEKQVDKQGQNALDKAKSDCGGGSGADGKEQSWEAGEPRDEPAEGTQNAPGAPKPAGKDELSIEVMRHDAAKAIAAGKAAGTIPGGLARWAEAKLAPPKIRWERELRAKVRRAVSFIAGHDDFTYARPSHRRIPGVILPGTHSPELVVDVLLDDSGSMGDGPGSRLARAVAEIDGVCKAATRVRFTACDAAVNSKRATFEGRAGDVLSKFTGGGGTDMRVGIEAALANKPKPRLIIVLTDGETPWPDAKPKGCEVIVALVEADASARRAVPKWASVVAVED